MIYYATVDDLESGWRELDADEKAIAQTLLGRASAKITKALQDHNITIDTDDEVQMMNLCAVACSMVKRVLQTGGSGVQSVSQGIGATNASLTFLNPDESLYFTKSDRETLGITGGSNRYRAVHAHTWADDAQTAVSGESVSVAYPIYCI